MAKRAPKHQPKPALSELAQWLLAFHGITRLKMIRDEYEAGLPPDMPSNLRQCRIDAINEIIVPKQ